MRARMLLLVLAILAVAGFAFQNWPAINERSLLNFGVLQSEAPLGLILLTLLGLTLVAALVATASMRTRSLVESRQHAKALHAQRELAEKAEASRFTELRTALDAHLRDAKQRESLANAEMDRAMAQHQRELRNQLEQMYHLLTSRLTELERRIDQRLQRPERVEVVQPAPAAEPVQARGPLGRERV